MATLNAGSLTMQFDALINQAGKTPVNSVNVLLDSGATHNFMPLALNLHLHLIHPVALEMVETVQC